MKKNRIRAPKFSQVANLSPMLEKATMNTLEKNNRLVGNKRFAIVEDVLNETTLLVYFDQSHETIQVNCSPHVVYELGDRVIVEYINNDPQDRYVTSVLNGGYDIDIIDYESLPSEPVEIIYNSKGLAIEFIYGYDNPKTMWRQELERNAKGQVENIYHYYPDGWVMVRTLFRDEVTDRVYKYE